MIHAVAIITLQPGMRDAFLQAFEANAEFVRTLPGCTEYAAAIDVEGGPPFQTRVGPDGVVIRETWADMASLGAHAAGAHMKAFGAKTKGMVASRAIYLLQPAAAAAQAT